jgi:putative transposase
MPKAQRRYIPGHVWLITHRCHEGRFLLKFGRDRERYLHWLFEARKRYGLSIMNYAVTCSHVHLVLADTGSHVIPRSIRLVAGMTAQEHGERKGGEEPFWEERYHAVAVQTGEPLVRCMIYLDLNMVRAGEVAHPEDWPHSGYGEIVYPPIRYTLIDRKMLARLLFMKNESELSGFYRSWIEEGLSQPPGGREPAWTESLAVGSRRFEEDVRGELSSRAIARQLGAGAEEDMFALREVLASQGGADAEGPAPHPDNTFPWDAAY